LAFLIDTIRRPLPVSHQMTTTIRSPSSPMVENRRSG
jgi:hypothetical protein